MKNARTYWLLILGCIALSVFCLAYPIYVIRPFRPQGPGELALALFVMQVRPYAAVACLIVTMVAIAKYWRLQPRLWRRIGATAAALAVPAAAVLARVNVYELMFYPMGAPVHISVAEANLDKDEKVLAVQMNGTARAYPVRSLAYHHIANDVVGGVPITATY